MRIFRSLAVAALLGAGLVTVAGLPVASAAEPITGQLLDSSTDDPVAGMTVRLLTSAPDGSPGTEVTSDVTGADGRFSLPTNSASGEDEFWLRVVPGTYMGGWIGNDAVQLDRDNATTHAAGAALGPVGATPAFVSGALVRAGSRDAVQGIVVTMRPSTDRSMVLGRDTTGPHGRFRITGLRGDDGSFGLKANGAPVGYESGWRSGSAEIVPTWGEAAASPLGEIGEIRIQRRR